MIHVGIDPGLKGAIAAISDASANTGYVDDMPRMVLFKTGFVKNVVDVKALARILGTYANMGARFYLEKVSSRGGQGVASMFSLGMSFWGAAGVIAGVGCDVVLIEPKEWKSAFNLSGDKNLSLMLARRLYPGVDLKLAKHDGRAEALLIARYGSSLK